MSTEDGLALEKKVVERAMNSVVSVLPRGKHKDVNPKEPEGSGVAVLDGAHILTALHVFNRAEKIHVRLYSGEIVSAKVVGRDKSTDLALLKIEQPLTPFEPGGDPDLGEEVCAIGNAFGLGLSLTCGTVSAIHRSDTGFNPVEDFVQTDAAVNPGASGGALIDQDGRLVGVLSAIFTRTSDANIGVNFAVSAPMALQIAKKLRNGDKIKWSFGGVVLRPVPKNGQTGKLGARVEKVLSGSAAEKAGLQAGDIIYDGGDRRIRKPRDFYSAVARLGGSDDLFIGFSRNGKSMTATLTFN
ncbi:MAG: S1C family serine protease [Hyphomicrobiales bacterium]